MKLHAFIVMPFGSKEGINFDRVYSDFLKPALEAAGLQVFRADEEQRAGEIRVDMFQQLLISDLVIAELSIDNPNVWYELGVRHALRARGIVLVQSRREHQPFDIYTDRKLRYSLKDGIPDPATVSEDIQRLTAMIQATLAAWHGHKVSPVYQLLDSLQEPDWKSLRVGSVREFWDAFEEWQSRVSIAAKRKLPGDILVLAEETPARSFALEAFVHAGSALKRLNQFTYALEQYERALEIDPNHTEARRQKGLLLGRLKRREEAESCLEELYKENPDDAETCAYLGRLEKDAWVQSWRKPATTTSEMRAAATAAIALLREAIKWYRRGFSVQCNHVYSGINAVTLTRLLRHLTGDASVDEECAAMEGGVRWAVLADLARGNDSFWTRTTRADLEVLDRDWKVVERSYCEAIAVSDNDWFALNSVREQLQLLRDLEFRTEVVTQAIALFEKALEGVEKPLEAWAPERIFLFSGHMVDAVDRTVPRLPPEKVETAAAAIKALLSELKAGPKDLGLCGGASGGDLLFAEALLACGGRLEVRIPLPEPQFIAKSVAFEKAPSQVPDDWRKRYLAVKANPNTRLLTMPKELGPGPSQRNPYERNNVWQLYTALSYGEEKVHFICLWDRKTGDGTGGTRHMHDEVSRRTGQIHVLDTTKLW